MIVTMKTQQLPNGVNIVPLPAFTDNYIWCFSNSENCVVVDPGDASVVEAFCHTNGLELTAILITHHHADHTGGLPKLTSSWPNVKVYGPQNPSIKLLTDTLVDGDRIQIEDMNLEFDIIQLPGHTLDHIGFIGHGGILCGDTLFSAGCGRLFEGTPAQMLESLSKLAALPEQTLVWCTHEYTLANLEFAAAVEADNQDLQHYTKWAMQMREQDTPTLPSDIKTQKAINPFLRSHVAAVKQSAEKFAKQDLPNDLDVFAAVRQWKDDF